MASFTPLVFAPVVGAGEGAPGGGPGGNGGRAVSLGAIACGGRGGRSFVFVSRGPDGERASRCSGGTYGGYNEEWARSV